MRRVTLAAPMTLLLATLVVGAACNRSDAPAPAARPAGPAGTTGATEPVFKPIDPAAVPAGTPTITLPAPSGSAPSMAGELVAAMVTDLAAGWPVNLAVGQELTARLAADPGGARWALRPGTDGGVVALQGPPTTDTTPGQAPMEVFRLKATKAGKTSLTFDLSKGPSATPLRSVSYPVAVQ